MSAPTVERGVPEGPEVGSSVLVPDRLAEALPSEAPPAEPVRRRRRPLPSTPGLVVLGLMVVSALWAVVGSLVLFPLGSSDNDEGVYLLQADALAEGHLFPPAPEHHRPFTPWFGVYDEGDPDVPGGRYVLKYTPVHATLLAAGRLAFGTERATIALLAAVNVGLLYLLALEVLRDRRRAALAAGLLALSPLFLIQSTSFLTYLSSLALLQGFTVLLVRGVRSDRRWMVALSGLVLGIAFFARAYDALVLGLPVLAWAGLRWLRRGRRGSPSPLWAVPGGLLPLVAMLAFNRAATGHPLQLPFSLFEPLDTIGFGLRRLSPSDRAYDFGPLEGWQGVGQHMVLLATWMAGGLPLVVVAVWSAVRRRHEARQWWVIGPLLLFPLAYSVFWGPYNAVSIWKGTRLHGPFYFLPLLVPLCILGARGLVDLWQRARPHALKVGVGMVVVTAVLFGSVVDANWRHTRADRRSWRHVQEADTPALVFVQALAGPYLGHPLTFTRNPAELDDDVTYAVDVGNENFGAMQEFPDRTPYELRVGPRKRGDRLRKSQWSLTPVEPRQGRSVDLDLTVWNSTARRRVVLEVALNGTVTQYLLDDNSTRGEDYQLRMQVGDGRAQVEGLPVVSTRQTASASGPLMVRLRTGRRSTTAVRTAYVRSVPLRQAGSETEVLVPRPSASGAEPVSITAGPPVAPSPTMARELRP